jgi:hypothetical protein
MRLARFDSPAVGRTAIESGQRRRLGKTMNETSGEKLADQRGGTACLKEVVTASMLI